MKRIALALLLLLGAKEGAQAQKGFHAGIQLGYHMTGIINPTADNPSLKVAPLDVPYTMFKPDYGTMFGIAAGYNFIDKLGVQLEINKASQGGKAKGTSSAGKEIVRNTDLSYLQIPILLKFRTGTPENKGHFYALLGPQFNFLNSATMSYDWNSATTDAKAKEMFSTSDFGLALGLGADIDLSKNLYLNVGLRLFKGFTDLNAEAYRLAHKQTGTYDASTNFYGGLQAGVHYAF